MTAAKRTVLLCDGPRAFGAPRLRPCRARFLGDLREPLAAVRQRAKQRGWVAYSTSQDMFRVTVDYCPDHR